MNSKSHRRFQNSGIPEWFVRILCGSSTAINRIMKRYLRYHEPRSLDHLKTVLADSINDYNQIRPHGSLNGLTPMEAYTEPNKFLDFAKQKNLARISRIAENQQVNCSGCIKN